MLYIPVLHRGYTNFFERHREVLSINLIDPALVGGLGYLHKDIRALSIDQSIEVVRSLRLFPEVHRLTLDRLEELVATGDELICVDDDISRALVSRFGFGSRVTFDNVFLRWHRGNVSKEEQIVPDEETSFNALHQDAMRDALLFANRSHDWWRQVGGVLTTLSGEKLYAWNRHVPLDVNLYMDGDPRTLGSGGVGIELSTAIHAEAALIAEAARRGIATNGADLYVTTFPCPPCAYLIAFSGVRNLYYHSGYSLVSGRDVLAARGVRIVRVLFDESSP